MSHRPHTSSTTAAAGATAYMPAFWSQVDVSQSAARAAGTEPPITQAEETAPGTRGDPAGRVRDELLDDRGGFATLARERPVQAPPQLGERCRGADTGLAAVGPGTRGPASGCGRAAANEGRLRVMVVVRLQYSGHEGRMCCPV